MPRDPRKINSFVVIDFETSGADKEGNHAKKHAATEVAVMALNGVTLEEILRYDNKFKPYDETHIYSEDAAKLTGIYKQDCIDQGIELKQIVEDLCTVFTEANLHNTKTAKPVLVAHNWDFDKSFLQDIFRRAGVDLSKYVDGELDAYGNFQPHGIDTMDLAKQCWAEVTDTDTRFKLTNCCERAGIDVVDGHSAMNDVEPTADLLRFFCIRLRSGGTDVVAQSGSTSSHRQNFEW